MSESLAEEPSVAPLFELGCLCLVAGHLVAELVLLDLRLEEVEWLRLGETAELRVLVDLSLVMGGIARLIQDLHGAETFRVAVLLDLELVLNSHDLLCCRTILGVKDQTARQQFVEDRHVDLLISYCHVLNVLLRLRGSGPFEWVFLDDEVIQTASKRPYVHGLRDFIASLVELRRLGKELRCRESQVPSKVLAFEQFLEVVRQSN